MTWTLHARGASEIKSTSSNTGVGQRNRTEEMMWHPKGRKSGSDEERIRAPFVGFARCFFRLCLFFFFLLLLFSFLSFGSFSVSSFRSGFRSGGRDWERAGRRGEEGGRKRGQRREEVKVGFGGGMVWFWMRSGYFFFFSFGRIRKGFHHFFLVLSEFFLGEPSFRHSIWTSFIVSADKDVGRTDSTVPS